MEYSRLEEVQSVIPTTVRVLALTATATISTRKYIIKSLNMQNPEIVYISPMKENIFYAVSENLSVVCMTLFIQLLRN